MWFLHVVNTDALFSIKASVGQVCGFVDWGKDLRYEKELLHKFNQRKSSP